MEQKTEFKMKDGVCKITSEYEMTMEEFADKVLNLERKKVQALSSIEMVNKNIENAQREIEGGKNYMEQIAKDVENITKETEKAYQFLKSNHQEQLIIKIENQLKIDEENKAKQPQEAMGN